MRRAAAAAAAAVGCASACSNLLIPGGSTVDGGTIISYSADDSTLFGDIAHWPAAVHAPGALRDIYRWDDGKHLGAIPEAPATYNVVGNTNEHQLSITETTFGGLDELSGFAHPPLCNATYGCIDYGQLIYVTLQRAKTAQEAVGVIDGLLQTYGYASDGESFSIADPREVWMMEIVGKGSYGQGALWVAARVPDGSVSAHANQARIRTFPRDDPNNWRFAADVVSFARDNLKYAGTDEDFSFSDVYDPVTFEGARFCEARVFSFFVAVADPSERIESYLDYAQGYNLSNRMPLFVRVGHKISVNETMWHMRNHYEGTWLDPSQDVGAGNSRSPYRLVEGLTYGYDSKTYVNERFIGVDVAGWNVVAHQRPAHKFGVLWFGVDDSSFSLHAPIYGVTDRVPRAWYGSNCTGLYWCRAAAGLPGNMKDFSLDTMHWVGNMVANYAYSRYNVIAPTVYRKLAEVEKRLMGQVADTDARIAALGTEREQRAAATAFSHDTAAALHQEWLAFYGQLFARYVDGRTMEEDPDDGVCGCSKSYPGFDQATKRRIVTETGDHYLEPATPLERGPGDGRRSIHKLRLRALGGRGSGRR